MSPWKAPACTGSRSITCSRTSSPWCWLTLGTSKRCPGTRPMSRTVSGSRTCCATVCSKPASSRINRLQKTLEGANIKLASVVSQVTGVSARRLLAALLNGESPQVAQLVHGRLRDKVPQLERALTGRFGAHQRFMVARQLRHIDDLDHLIEELSVEIGERMRPFEEEIALLDTIPGVGRWAAEVILAEIGTDMGRFPTAGHLASWAGMCPGNNESAGKRRSGKTRKGSPWLRVTLTEAAYAAGR